MEKRGEGKLEEKEEGKVQGKFENVNKRKGKGGQESEEGIDREVRRR